jgi:Fe2+ or Zn2+ uptake regulation protein
MKPAIGRPRSLSETDLARVLSLSKAGLGSRSITRELQKAGVDVSRPTIQRALAKRGVYAE